MIKIFNGQEWFVLDGTCKIQLDAVQTGEVPLKFEKIEGFSPNIDVLYRRNVAMRWMGFCGEDGVFLHLYLPREAAEALAIEVYECYKISVESNTDFELDLSALIDYEVEPTEEERAAWKQACIDEFEAQYRGFLETMSDEAERLAEVAKKVAKL